MLCKMGHFVLQLLIRGGVCPKGYFCWLLTVIIGFCAKNHRKLRGGYLVMIFLSLMSKRLFLLHYYLKNVKQQISYFSQILLNKTLVIPRVGGVFTLGLFLYGFSRLSLFYSIKRYTTYFILNQGMLDFSSELY